ncbi:retrotransposon gag domain, retroviral aspartyl protease [Tanacetum coccineum]
MAGVFSVKASDLSSDHSIHREEEDQEGNNSLEIETLPLFPIHGASQHDFFGVKASDLSSDHSVGGYYNARMVGPHMDNTTDSTNHSKSGLGLPSIVALVMVIDKSWTSLGKHEKAFYTGLKKFVDDCKPLVDSAGNIRCPCKSCRLVLWVSIKHLSDHISKYGFDPSYKTWIHHGELDLPLPPPVIDNTRQPQMSDMTTCLYDLSYIPLNNEQNEPTQGDIGEKSNDPTQAKRNEFEELYDSANEELWKDSNTPGKKVPKKVLRYFTIIPRLQRLYKSSHTAKEMTWHATRKTRNVRLGLAADGFNPFDNSQSYSIWPVILTTYNLPPWLCMKESSFMLTLLFPGPKSPGKDIDVYLRPLIDDLKDLWAKLGVETINVAIGLKFNMRVMVLWTLHLRFLKKPNKWRRLLEFNGETKNGDPPREFSRDAIMTQLARLPTRVKAKSEGSIAEGYVAEEALTFSSHYFRDVTTKFNRPDRNVDCPPPTCQFQVFRSLCKSISLWSVIRIDHQELKNVIWYVLHNSPEIDTYRAMFKIEFPNKDLKEEFLGWFGKQIRQRHVDNDPCVNESSELFALACGPSQTPILVNSCVVNDMARTTLGLGKGAEHLCQADFARGTAVHGGGDDRPPPYSTHHLGVDLGNEGKNFWELLEGHQKIIWVAGRAGRAAYRQGDQNLGLKGHQNKSGPVHDPVCGDRTERPSCSPVTLRLMGQHLGVLVREVAYALPFFGAIMPHEEGGGPGKDWGKPSLIASSIQMNELDRLVPRWQKIYAGIQQHLQKIYNGKKDALKERYWVLEEDVTYNLKRIRRGRPSHISEDEMLRLQGLGSNTPTGVPYTEDEIMAIMLTQFESQPEYGGGSESGGYGDDEPRDDEDGNEDGEDEDEDDS